MFGWLRSNYPVFGRIPEPAIWIVDTLGLCAFTVIVGLNAGPSFVSGLQSTGFGLIFVGIGSSLLPHTLAIRFGRYVLKMNPLIVLGACAGRAQLRRRFARPNILGRGLSTPMLVILTGMIGGTLANGLIGLFVGPIVLAVSWE